MTRLYDALKPLFQPESVAVIGASGTPGKQGNSALKYLRQGGYKGRVYPINPGGGEIEGLTAYKSIKDTPTRVDCVLLVIPAEVTPAAIRQCAEAQVRSAIIGASGFAELGSVHGRRLQQEVTETARSSGMRVVGPNTNGIWNATDNFSLGYNTSHGDPMTPGPVSIVGHSGALFNSFAPRLRRFGAGLSKFVPVGNECDLDMLDFLEYLIEDPATQVIGLIVEGLADGERLRTLMARAHAARKHVVALKLGRSAAGAGAALAHSSRLAGSARAYAALFRECGVPVVRSIETLAGVCTLLSDPRAVSRDGHRGLISASSSGGGCSLIADHCADYGVPLAGSPDGSWEGAAAAEIATWEGAGGIRNPVDGGNLHGWARLERLLAALEKDRQLGPVLAFAHMLPSVASDMSLFTPLQRRKERTGSPVVVLCPGGMRPEMEARYAAEQMPVFSDIATCFESLRAVYDVAGFAAEREGAAGAVAPQPVRLAAGTVSALADAEPGDFLSELDSAAVLRAAGVPIVESTTVATAGAAAAVAERLGLPVVLKALVPGVAHKNDAGLVAVGLREPQAVREAYTRLEARARAAGGERAAATIILQPMLAARAELILGTTYEAPLGHFLVAGLGGVNAELMDTVVMLPVPMPPDRLRQRLEADRLGKLLQRLSVQSGVDLIGKVVSALAALQGLLLAHGDMIRSIDVNPLLVGDAGATAVDALIVRR